MVTGKAKKKTWRVPLKGAKSARASGKPARASGKPAPRQGQWRGAGLPEPLAPGYRSGKE